MIDYIIKQDDNKLYIAKDNLYITVDMTIQKYLNKILIEQLKNLNSLEKTTKRLFGFKNKIPLFIDGNTLLIPLISYRMEGSIYLNYFAISKYIKTSEGIIIYFYSGHCYKSYLINAFTSQTKKCLEMIQYFQKGDF